MKNTMTSSEIGHECHRQIHHRKEGENFNREWHDKQWLSKEFVEKCIDELTIKEIYARGFITAEVLKRKLEER